MLSDVFASGMGNWKNIIEMEEVLTIEELYLLMDAAGRAEERRNKFSAALQGIDLSSSEDGNAFDRVKRRADAALAGKETDVYALESLGIVVEDDD